ncbi:hypothetical protein E2I00_016399, partial [Balaenoptera physalus]
TGSSRALRLGLTVVGGVWPSLPFVLSCGLEGRKGKVGGVGDGGRLGHDRRPFLGYGKMTGSFWEAGVGCGLGQMIQTAFPFFMPCSPLYPQGYRGANSSVRGESGYHGPEELPLACGPWDRAGAQPRSAGRADWAVTSLPAGLPEATGKSPQPTPGFSLGAVVQDLRESKQIVWRKLVSLRNGETEAQGLGCLDLFPL